MPVLHRKHASCPHGGAYSKRQFLYIGSATRQNRAQTHSAPALCRLDDRHNPVCAMPVGDLGLRRTPQLALMRPPFWGKIKLSSGDGGQMLNAIGQCHQRNRQYVDNGKDGLLLVLPYLTTRNAGTRNGRKRSSTRPNAASSGCWRSCAVSGILNRLSRD